MPEMHLKQPGFIYSDCSPFTKNRERIQKFQKTRDAKYIYRYELDKACFRHDMSYVYFNPIQNGEGKKTFALLTFSFNPFATLVYNFRFLPSASPKLLNLNQEHISKKAVFLVKSL